MVLDALVKIKNEIDPILTFRRCCSEGICRSCLMKIDGRLGRGCLTQIPSGGPTKIMPLPHSATESVDVEPSNREFSGIEFNDDVAISVFSKPGLKNFKLVKVCKINSALYCGLTFRAREDGIMEGRSVRFLEVLFVDWVGERRCFVKSRMMIKSHFCPLMMIMSVQKEHVKVKIVPLSYVKMILEMAQIWRWLVLMLQREVRNKETTTLVQDNLWSQERLVAYMHVFNGGR